jgi:hypothetical protein
MVSNRIAVGALSLACIAAAGAGGYLATRHDVSPIAAPVAAGAPEPAATPSTFKESPSAQAEVAIGSAAPIAAPPASLPAKAPTTVAKGQLARNAETRTRRPEQDRRTADRASSAPAADLDRPAAPMLPAARDRTVEPTASAQSAAGASNTDAQPLTARVEPLQAEAPRDVAAPRDAAAPHGLEPTKRQATVEELVVPADSVIGLQLDTSVNSEQARVEDRVDARVVRDVRVGGSVAVVAGSRAVGTVVVVERGGRFKERARLGIRFHTLMLADGSSLPISTDTIYRLGEGPGNGTAARIGGGAVVGAIIGGIIGGGKGAAIGATTGAGAGTASVMSTERNTASFPAGAEVTARILSPVAVTIERQ